ncbi:hypothetical protein U3516DRAFT_738366 [Neocallimastix sp. 'constans']
MQLGELQFDEMPHTHIFILLPSCHCHSKVQVLVERTLIELTHFLEKYFNNYFFEDNFENLNCNLKFSNIGHSLGKYIQKV